MRHFMHGFVLVLVWASCIMIGILIACIVEPRGDVEFAMAAWVGMIVGGVLGPFLGFWVGKLVKRTT